MYSQRCLSPNRYGRRGQQEYSTREAKNICAAYNGLRPWCAAWFDSNQCGNKQVKNSFDN